ncbi:MAG: glycosyltransferase [Gemmatimonadota bacterium]|nr:MAG: glycosyltransferase [Gemmatimonadota bacterium]
MRQTIHEGGPPTELVVVFDGPGIVHDLLPRDDRIRLIQIDEGRSLGAKFNACVENALGEHIVLWSDDDWHHPERVERLVENTLRFCDVPIAGSQTALFAELISPGDTYVYRSADGTLVGGTCGFERDLAIKVPFPDRPSGVDTVWQFALQEANVPFTVGNLPDYVAFQHGQTTGRKTWPPKLPSRVWTKLDSERAAELLGALGDDLSAYRRALSRATSQLDGELADA